ncbi:hypothetical protein N0V94_002945 [Neodidymelliopsis sp. IMI 364377]|nr:hypothetical protein N0V94_002945 [Neodidymelliopsis sp. IMI 364377]
MNWIFSLEADGDSRTEHHSEEAMCFGQADSEGEGELTTGSGKIHKEKRLKRERSPAEADNTAPQDPQKLSKLDSTASTLANDHGVVSQKLSMPRKYPKRNAQPPNFADNGSLRIERHHPAHPAHHAHSPQGRMSESSAHTLAPYAGTTVEHHTAFIGSYNAPEELYSYSFQTLIGLPISPALRFQLVRSTMMLNDELAACFDLISSTSQQAYEASARGWDPSQKMLEMLDKNMMYLLVRQAEGYVGTAKVESPTEDRSNTILGFLSFAFDFDEQPHADRQVLYIFEVHLDDRLRGQSLGTRMLKWTETQARLVNVSKMMLTVFTSNEGARRMYEREGFVKDECSPGDRVTRRKVVIPDYLIMSKEL